MWFLSHTSHVSSAQSERTGTLGDHENSVMGEGKGFLTG